MNTSIQELGFGGIDETGCAACHRFWIGSRWRSFSVIIAILILMACLLTGSAFGQSFASAAVNYILRDEGGKVLDESELKVVYERMSKLPSEVGSVYIGTAFWQRAGKH